MVVFSLIFVVDTKIIDGYNFVAPLKICLYFIFILSIKIDRRN